VWLRCLLIALVRSLSSRPSEHRASIAPRRSASRSISASPSTAGSSSWLFLPTEELVIPVKAGDRVVALFMPHLGVGIIDWGPVNGRVKVSFEVGGRPFSDEFGEREIGMASRIKAAA
jgi:hypothetical protein